LQGVLEGTSDDAAPAEVMELSIMSLSKGDLAAFLRARADLPSASLAAPPSTGLLPGAAPAAAVSDPFNFAVDTARRPAGRTAPPKRVAESTVDSDESSTAKPNRKWLIIGLATAGAVAAGVGIWLAMR